VEQYPVALIERRIYLIRGERVMMSGDLAELYQVPAKSLNLAVRRNADRFPGDFMFQLTKQSENLRLQFETSSWGGRRYLPYAFTERGSVISLLADEIDKMKRQPDPPKRRFGFKGAPAQRGIKLSSDGAGVHRRVFGHS